MEDESPDFPSLMSSKSISSVHTTISGAISEVRSEEPCRDWKADSTPGVDGSDVRLREGDADAGMCLNAEFARFLSRSLSSALVNPPSIPNCAWRLLRIAALTQACRWQDRIRVCVH